MADANEIALAKTVYTDLCAVLERKKWIYKKHEEDLVVTFGVSGKDIPMDFVFAIDADRQLLRVFSKLPFTVPEDKRMDLAIATCVASNKLADGSFDYDITTGTIIFRMTASFRESKIGDGLFDYLIGCSCFSVDEFNDNFFALCKGIIGIYEFICS